MSSSVNADCTELYKEAKKYLNLSQKSISRFESCLRELSCTAKSPKTKLAGKLKALHDVEPLLQELGTNLGQMAELENRFLSVARQEKSCRKTYFYRARHIMTSLEKAKLSQTFLLQHYVDLLVRVAAKEGCDFADWLYVLRSADQLNKLLSEHKLCEEDTVLRTLLHGRRHRGAHVHENFGPSHFLYLRQLSGSRVLRTLANERAVRAAEVVTKGIVVGIDAKMLELAAEEVCWLTVPGEDTTNSRLEMPKVIDLSKDSKKQQQHHFTAVEEFVAAEEVFLNGLFHVFSQVPGLLGKGALKKKSSTKSNGGNSIGRSTKLRMLEYYNDLLWRGVGHVVERSLLWGGEADTSVMFVPFALQHPRLCLGLANVLSDHLYAKFGDGYPPVVFPCIQSAVESLNLHVVSAAWDVQYLHCLAESSRAKLATVAVEDMRAGTMASKTGKLFYDGLKAIVRLNNRCHPDMMRDFVEHGSHDPEEYPFLEELSAMRRLLAILFSLRNWANHRAHAALHSWQVKDFLLVTQADMLNIEDCFTILQLESHERNAHTKCINIQLYTHVQGSISQEIQECQKSLREIPRTTLIDMSTVCRTISLATLQNVFPSERYWRQTHVALPSKASEYVAEFIEKILAPVFEALRDMKVEIQQTVARIAIKSFCEAWLEHIRSTKIKFSEFGAKQLGLDFQAFRQWISSNEHVKEESRRYLLLLDSLRQCEGVAKLLQARPGEVVDIRPTKNRVSPMTATGEENGGPRTTTSNHNHHRAESPINQILDAIPAELYVPDQQEWLSRKANSKLMSLPFCCR